MVIGDRPWAKPWELRYDWGLERIDEKVSSSMKGNVKLTVSCNEFELSTPCLLHHHHLQQLSQTEQTSRNRRTISGPKKSFLVFVTHDVEITIDKWAADAPLVITGAIPS